MACATEAICLWVFLFCLQLFPLVFSTSTGDPTPAPWPPQFHSVQFWNTSGSLQKNDLWYDWPNGRNFNIIQDQLGKILYSLEWNNGTSFYYTLDPFDHYCHVRHHGVGILRPNWLDGANYLGQQYADNFLCNVWEKVDFVWYYEDVLTRRPVKWVFYTARLMVVGVILMVSAGMIVHVMTFEVGAVLEDKHWQAPVYCFNETATLKKSGSSLLDLEPAVLHWKSMREIAHQANAK